MCARQHGYFDGMLWQRAGAGSRPGGRGTFLCVAKETYPKERRPRCPCPPRRWRGGSLRCSVLGCTAELAAFPLRVNSAQTSAVGQTTMHVSFGTCSPQVLRFSARSEGGGNGPHTGHCFARPVVLRCARLARAAMPPVGSAQREPAPGAAAQQQPSLTPLPTPSGCAEKRRAWGGCVCRRTHALRALARRGCLSGVRRTQRVPRRHPRTEHRRLPAAKRRDADWGPPSLW